MRINTIENSAGNDKAIDHDDQSKENAAGNDDADDDIYIYYDGVSVSQEKSSLPS